MVKRFLKSIWFLPLLVALVIGGLFMLPKKEFAPLPSDAVHAGLTDNSSCTDCHSKRGESSMSEKHPPKDQCLTCHKTQ